MKLYRPYHSAPKKRGKIRKILTFLGYLVGAGIIIIAGVFIYFVKDLPNPDKISERQITQSTKIYDRTGQVLLYDVHGEEKRTVVPLDQISKSLQQATISTEDANFYHHFGLDFKGIARAVWGVITNNKSAGGGSTITQQFIKKSFFTDKRSYTRKFKEWILALELEAKYSKDEILGFYLNQIPYGSNAYGAEAASQTFFNKSAKDLTLAESALLAALPQAPSYYSPYGSHPEDLKARQEYVLERMEKLGHINREEMEAAKGEKLNFSKNTQIIKAPHFVMYIKEYLEAEYGEEMVERGGLKVYTSLDWDLQQAAQEIVEKGAQDNQAKYGAYNAALSAVDPKTGQILVMVGSKDYFADALPQGCEPGKTCRFEPNVNVSVRNRQPGSSFKPFAYALAFQKGFLPETTLFDLKTEFNSSCPPEAVAEQYNGQRCYNPQNYDGSFRGPVSMRQALAQSLNIPAVKTLYLAGIPETIEYSRAMGITTLKDKDRYGLALVLGGGEVKLIDEVAAYGVFAADGIKNEKTAILKIENSEGKILEEFKADPKKVMEPQIARLISDVLSDNEARAPVFGQSSPLYISDRPTAVKTGTTQEYRDAWTVGYTPSLTAGVWVGNNNNAPMAKAGAGLYAAAPLWNAFIKKAYEIKADNQQPIQNSFTLQKEPEQFIKPEIKTTDKPVLNGQIFSEAKVKIDKISGKLATDLTPPDLIQEVLFKEIHTILYYLDKDDPLGEAPKNPSGDQQFSNWEWAVQNWAKTSGWVPQLPPSSQDDVHKPENQPTIQIVSPNSGQAITQKSITISVQAQAKLGIKQIDFFFDNQLIGTDTKEPYSITYNLPRRLSGAAHTIKVRAYDQAYNRQETEIQVFTYNIPGIIIEPEETLTD
ncbi:MAG: PBP1A family penicillin-binding protein [Candidatus Portnoybacteria bacterium]|nr:PBP1A family penicillin-binding protein [Candidatus Portnoybacteria bacterium]